MISFITNMSSAVNVTADAISARDLIDQWIAEGAEDFDGETAEDFLASHTVTNVSNNNGINEANLDSPLADFSTLSVLTKAVATGGSKGA